jgi:hypothetical protein
LRTFWTTTDTASNADRRNNFIKKSHRSKKFIAYAQVAHLLLAATAQPNPKPKAKEPLPQRFIEFTVC